MMNLDPKQKYQNFELTIPSLTKPVPCLIKFAKNVEQTDTVVLFVNGLNGTKQVLYYFPGELDYAHLITYDARACGRNENETTIHVKPFLQDLKEILMQLKKELQEWNIKHWILCGESFGAAQSTLFYTNFAKEVDVTIVWNMPYHIVNIFDYDLSQKYHSFNVLFYSLITNKATYSAGHNLLGLLIRNKKLATLPYKEHYYDNRNSLAAWLATKKAWKNLLKLQAKNQCKFPLIYITTKEDGLIDMKKTAKLEQNQKKYCKNKLCVLSYPYGMHCLFMDDFAGVMLVNFLNEMVQTIHADSWQLEPKKWQQAINNYFAKNKPTQSDKEEVDLYPY